MSPRTQGWMLFIAAIGMLFGGLSAEIAKIEDWNEITRPSFVGSLMAHIAAVIMAFVGGKLIPEHRSLEARTRATDSVLGLNEFNRKDNGWGE